MRKKWVLPTVSFTLTLLLISWYINANSIGGQNTQLKPLSTQKVNEQETELKLKILQDDISQSAQLIQAEALHDILSLTDTSSYKQVKNEIDRIRTEHPHIVYLKWEMGNHKVQSGTIPKIKADERKGLLGQANSSLMQKSHYISPIFKAEDLASYQILVSKNEDIKATIYVKQTIIPLVEHHQKKNLRLIPYPMEKEFSEYETVKANSTEPIQVLTAEDNENASHYYDREVVVKLTDTLSTNQLKQIQSDIDGSLQLQLNGVYIFKSNAIDTKELISYFRRNWDTIYVEPHYIYVTNVIDTSNNISTNITKSNEDIPNDALFTDYQWNLTQISTPNGWLYSKGSDAVTIAILDTGVNFNHPDLQTRLLKGINAIDSNYTAEDDVGHGTHVTGIIGAQANNNEGIAGISWYNNILPVKVLNGSGYGSSYAVAQGVIWATDQGAKVINLSLGNYASADFLHEAIQYAYSKDVVIIAATGNDNTNRPGYPAAYPEVLAVGATDSSRNRAVFSNYGDYIDVVAPGDAIPSTYLSGQYAALSGTSMATPHVAALAGLVRSINPQLTNVQVMDIIKQSAADLGEPDFDIYYGYGEINVERALALAASYNGTLQSYSKDLQQKVNDIIEQQ